MFDFQLLPTEIQDSIAGYFSFELYECLGDVHDKGAPCDEPGFSYEDMDTWDTIRPSIHRTSSTYIKKGQLTVTVGESDESDGACCSCCEFGHSSFAISKTGVPAFHPFTDVDVEVRDDDEADDYEDDDL